MLRYQCQHSVTTNRVYFAIITNLHITILGGLIIISNDEAIRSLTSTYNKLAKAYDTMAAKGAPTTLVQKRRDAVKVAIACLMGNEVSEAQASCEVLQSLVPAITTQLAKAKRGSAQHTLNARRLAALQLAIAKLN